MNFLQTRLQGKRLTSWCLFKDFSAIFIPTSTDYFVDDGMTLSLVSRLGCLSGLSHPAFTFKDEDCSFGKFLEIVSDFGADLSTKMCPGDRIACVSPPSVASVVVLLSAHIARCIFVPIDPCQ